ncbi:hypothetical protein Hanom_Chr06g00479761 [Helianthus anomalus]
MFDGGCWRCNKCSVWHFVEYCSKFFMYFNVGLQIMLSNLLSNLDWRSLAEEFFSNGMNFVLQCK